MPGSRISMPRMPQHEGQHRAGEQGRAQAEQKFPYRAKIARVSGLRRLARHERAAHEECACRRRPPRLQANERRLARSTRRWPPGCRCSP